jgi:hypothetical protein
LKHGELKSRNNSKSVAMPRQIAMYLCKSADERVAARDREELRRQAPLDRHPLHPKVEDLRKKDGDFNTLINSFLESFR